MFQEFSEIYFYLKGALRFKRIATVTALLICVIGWLVVFFMPNKYESKAKVHIDTESMIRPLMKGMVVDPDVVSMIRIIQQLMFTRPNLEKIAEISLLNKDMKAASDKMDFFDKLQKTITIKSAGSRDIFDITYTAKDPDVARSVVQAVLTVFSENTQGKAISDTSDAQNFIEQQIRNYEIRLQEAEKNKEDFKRNNMELLAESDFMNSMQEVSRQLQESTIILQQLEAKKDVLEVQLNKGMNANNSIVTTSSAIDDKANLIGDDDPKIQDLLNRRRELLLKYTDKHPQILGIDELIADIRKNNANKPVENRVDSDANTQVVDYQLDSYHQSLKTNYDNVVADLASQKVLVEAIKARKDKIQNSFKDKLTMETELKNLNRDYEAINKQYMSLIERREQAHITEDVDDQTSRLKFKIADPPSKPLKPAFPNRILFYSSILGVGLASGIAVAVLLYLMKPVYMSVDQIKNLTGLPVLGSVSLIVFENKGKRNLDWVSISMILIMLISFSLLITIELIKV